MDARRLSLLTLITVLSACPTSEGPQAGSSETDSESSAGDGDGDLGDGDGDPGDPGDGDGDPGDGDGDPGDGDGDPGDGDGDPGDGDGEPSEEVVECDPECGIDCPLRVDAGAIGGGPGTSWDTAFATVQGAISCSVPGQAIWIAGGEYPGLDENPVALIPHALELYGGFGGDEQSLDERIPGAFETSLGPAQDSVVRVEDPVAPELRLDGLTIREGHAQVGGGLYLSQPLVFQTGSVTIHRVEFVANSASDRGGGIGQLFSSPITITQSSFRANIASAGSAIWSTDALVNIESSEVSNNSDPSALGSSILDTGTFFVADSELIFNHGRGFVGARISFVDGRIAHNEGGGIDAQRWALIEDSVVENNGALDGGGLRCWALLSECIVRRSLFRSNDAHNRGGAIAVTNSAELDVFESRFVDNASTDPGGAIAAPDASAQIEDSEFVGNSSSTAGGAVFGPVLIRRSSFHDNRVGEDFEAVSDNQGFFEPVIQDSVLWPDIATLIPDPNLPPDPQTVSVSRSCLPSGSDPQLVWLGIGNAELEASPFELLDADQDGLTELYLDPLSPCVDLAGNPGPLDFDWQAATTASSQCTDAPPLDAGVHYPPTQMQGPC